MKSISYSDYMAVVSFHGQFLVIGQIQVWLQGEAGGSFPCDSQSQPSDTEMNSLQAKDEPFGEEVEPLARF